MSVAPTVADPAFTPKAFTATAVPTSLELHMMNRLGCGYSRSLFTQLRAAGGAQRWFEKQLTPTRVAETAKIKEIDSWFPGLRQSPATKKANDAKRTKTAHEYALELGNWSMLRRMFSTRTVHENMVEFWSHHLHVTAFGGKAWATRYSYDATIRAHALGRFDQLLTATTLHPSMLLFLDNFRSVRNDANENHGRELLELHTVGRTSGYTEQMVKDSAVILSGWTVRLQTTQAAYYDKNLHTVRPVKVLGFTHSNAAADGQAVTKAYLNYLAHHPATAQNIARKLAIRFVSDTPSQGLVDRLAKVFLDSGTDISATLRALVASPEFVASRGVKVRTPVEDLVATARVLMLQPRKPTGTRSFARAIGYVHGSDKVYSWPRPDGEPITNDTWCSASRMLNSYRMHWGLAGEWNPTKDVSYRNRLAWLPVSSMRFDTFTDHMCRMLLGRPSTQLILKACCEATGLKASTTINKKHQLFGWMFPRYVGALLDSPAHMSR